MSGLTPEREAEIRVWHEGMRDDQGELLAEIDRLREIETGLRQALRLATCHSWASRYEQERERADRATQAIRNALALRMDDHVHHHAYEKKVRAILREGLPE